MSSNKACLCLSCGLPSPGHQDACPGCGSQHVASIFGDAIVEFPAHSLPCPRCGSEQGPLLFRTWAYQYGFLFWCRDGRMAAYLCPECTRMQTAKALSLTGLLGWWSLPSWLFFAWRATYYNWRAIWTYPANPLKWGAVPAQTIIDDMRRAFEAADEEFDEEELVFEGSPLAQLTRNERATVVAASGLYELLGVKPSSSREELRGAYRRAALDVHPDLRGGDTATADEMIELNLAWSVLGDERLRAAYDWMQREKARAL